METHPASDTPPPPEAQPSAQPIRLASVWLGGCSGCHMSFLDLDEWLFELARQVEWVYSPLMDIKTYPEQVDVVLVEGAIANADHVAMIRQVRDRSRFLIAFGDCAVTGNVTALRNVLGSPEPVLQRAYVDLAETLPQLPTQPGLLPPLVQQVQPIHRVVPVDLYLPGCPPAADRIRAVLEALLQGEVPSMAGQDLIQFG